MEIVRGHGRLDGTGRVTGGRHDVRRRRGVVLNAGTEPATLPIEGLAGTPYWTNREVMRLTELPAQPGRGRRRPDRCRARPRRSAGSGSG